ncbi:MAG: acylneuraminate cytidylyltransferase family protein [Bacteroidetes bacterium]|nr:acylneuraminate cytidylyltransferase family protein [Bacteroidota bacterium]
MLIRDKSILVVIPARGQSKRLPGKNIKPLAGKPLISYTIECARALVDDKDICVSTDDREIISIVEKSGLKVPFKRPDHLATDTASSNDVLVHAVNFYEEAGKKIDILILLQPTSPLRTVQHVKEALDLFSGDLDMVVSVKRSHAASLLCNESPDGFLRRSSVQSDPESSGQEDFYEYNGAVYIINVEALKEKSLSGFTRVRKYVMDKRSSIDIDTPDDFEMAQSLFD